MAEFLKLTKPKDLKNWAYETIKEIILKRQVEPRDQLRIEDLAKKMNVSRTPIREALLRLESEGLVKANSRVGFFVTEITRTDLEELFELRKLTEGYAAGKAALLLTEEDIAHMDEKHRQAIAAFEQDDLMKFNDHEIALHDFLISHSGNGRLLKVVEGLKDLTYRERLIALKSRENVRQSIQEHRRLIEALHEKNGALAEALMREHLENVKNRLLESLSFAEEGEAKGAGG